MTEISYEDKNTQKVHPSQSGIRVLISNDHMGYEDSGLHGVGTLMIQWSTAFDTQRVRVIACVLRKGGDLGEQLSREGVQINYFGDERFNPISIWKFVKLIRQYQIEVLHLHGFGASLFGRLAGLLTHTPAIVHVHSYVEVPGYHLFWKFIDRILARWTARAIAVSKPVKTFCVEQMGFRPDQVEVVHNPAPVYRNGAASAERVQALRDKYGLAPNSPVVGTTSRISFEKGLHVLLDAFATVVCKLPQARLLMVGDGPQRCALEQQARALGISDAVIFSGFQRDVAAHLGLFWISAAPSVWQEPCPLSVIESLAAGVPVIASRVGGLTELVSHEETGLLVEQGNPHELATAILRTFEDPELRRRLGDGCRLDRRRFDLRQHLLQLETIYREVAAVRTHALSGTLQ